MDSLKAGIRNQGRLARDRVEVEVTLQAVTRRLEDKTELQRNYTKLLNSLEKKDREGTKVPNRSPEVDMNINIIRDGIKRLRVLEKT